MATLVLRYNHTWKLANAYGLPLAATPLRLHLVSSGYVFSAAHTAWDNGANNNTDPSFNELVTAGGYTAGGQLLQNPVVADATIDFDDVIWASLTATFRAAICKATGTFNGVTDPLLFYMLFDSTPADIVTAGSEFKVTWNDLSKVFYDPT